MFTDRKSTLLGLSLIASAFGLSLSASADTPQIDPTVLKLNLGSPIELDCKNPGTHQDVSKSPSLKNTAGATIAKGTTVYWSATDNDSGAMKLEADLPPGASVQVLGKPGNSYSCKAHFLTKADLVVKKAQFASQTSASVQIQNLDAWIDAKPSIVRVEVVSCAGPVLASVDTTPLTVDKGQVRELTVPFGATSGKKYLRVRADATGLVSEKSETNNLWDDQGTCIH